MHCPTHAGASPARRRRVAGQAMRAASVFLFKVRIVSVAFSEHNNIVRMKHIIRLMSYSNLIWNGNHLDGAIPSSWKWTKAFTVEKKRNRLVERRKKEAAEEAFPKTEKGVNGCCEQSGFWCTPVGPMWVGLKRGTDLFGSLLNLESSASACDTRVLGDMRATLTVNLNDLYSLLTSKMVDWTCQITAQECISGRTSPARGGGLNISQTARSKLSRWPSST